jgi:hypothetical protein
MATSSNVHQVHARDRFWRPPDACRTRWCQEADWSCERAILTPRGGPWHATSVVRLRSTLRDLSSGWCEAAKAKGIVYTNKIGTVPGCINLRKAIARFPRAR